MSVISAYEPVPNRVRSLVRIVAVAGPLQREELTAYMMPGDEQRPDQVGNIVREAVRLGLLTETNQETVLADGIRPRDVANDSWFEGFIERALFSRVLAEGDENRPVAFATAWLLTRPTVPELEWRADLANAMHDDMEGDDRYDVTNVDRAAMLAYWVGYTGYGEALNFENTIFLIPDPTRAIVRQLDSLLQPGERLAMRPFLERLAASMPVLEGGVVRMQVERRLRRQRDPATLSQATSLALLRLRRRGLIVMHADSDAENWLLDVTPDNPRPITHISRQRPST